MYAHRGARLAEVYSVDYSLNMKRFTSIIFALAAVSVAIFAADPTATRYSAEECQGSLRPYVVPKTSYDYPDTLTPVHINHVGRHGSRYPAGATHCRLMANLLRQADSLGTITAKGKSLRRLVDYAIAKTAGNWGALDSLGMAEHRGIASRMYLNFPMLFKDGKVEASSSYSPRSMMSMYSFVHQLARMDNHVEIKASSGRSFSATMRPFDVNEDYINFRKEGSMMPAYEEYLATKITDAPLRRVLGDAFPIDDSVKADYALAEYYVLAGMTAMEVSCNLADYFTIDELNALWSCFNLRQYLQWSMTTVSTIPADIAAPLILDIIAAADKVVEGKTSTTVNLRFGHAETVMPLTALLRLKGCYYLTNYFDTVAQHWRDFEAYPMAANVQFILFKSRRGGYYLRVDLNEVPVPLMPSQNRLYTPWREARDYMMRCIPIYYQP